MGVAYFSALWRYAPAPTHLSSLRKKSTLPNDLGQIDVVHRYAVADGALQVQNPPIRPTRPNATEAIADTYVFTIYGTEAWAKARRRAQIRSRRND